MASYERIVCMTCKDTCDLGCKRAGKTVKMLLSNIDKLVMVERLISEINEGFGAYEGIKGLELTASWSSSPACTFG